jgi:hypothetical protein
LSIFASDTTTRHVETKCPTCSKKLDASNGPGAPEEGDLSVCAYCLTMLRYGPGLALRELRPEEFDALHADERAALIKARNLLASIGGFPRRRGEP